MCTIKEFAEHLVKLTEEEIVKLSEFIKKFEQIVKDSEVSDYAMYAGLHQFNDPIYAKIKEYLSKFGFVNGKKGINDKNHLVNGVWWMYCEVLTCDDRIPGESNNVTTSEKQVVILKSIREMKDTIMLNIPYELWCKYFI